MEAIRSQERDDYDKTADLYDRATLQEIVKLVQGHPLAALNAVKYIIRVSNLSILWQFSRKGLRYNHEPGQFGVSNADLIQVVSQYKEAIAGRMFIAMLGSNKYEDRLRFLDYRPDSPSIMETFQVSQDRLPKPNGAALAITNFLSKST